MKRLIVSFLFMLMLPTLGFSHSPIKEAVPSSGHVLITAPEKVTIKFGKPFEPVFSKIEVFDRDGNKVSEKPKYLEDDTIIEVGIKENGSSGEYTVKWKCMSLDGHSKSGNYKFMVK
ncbi:MAG: copper resistance protein CopC [Nitrospiraceae bacterium]|nr:MAG: copper resistance protein CopC [Nitrospiraceae bacterium]